MTAAWQMQVVCKPTSTIYATTPTGPDGAVARYSCSAAMKLPAKGDASTTQPWALLLATRRTEGA